MSLNIKNEAVHDLVRQLAELTGVSQTRAVEDAVRHRLDELTAQNARSAQQKRAAKLADVRRIVAEYNRDLPARSRPYVEIMDEMYDEMGLPR